MSSRISAGALSAGKLTAGSLEEHFRSQGVHPEIIKKLKAGGLFSSIVNGVKRGIKFVQDNQDNIGKAIQLGKSLHDAVKGGKMSHHKVALAVKNSNQKRLKFIGEKRRAGYSMQEANDMWRKHNK